MRRTKIVATLGPSSNNREILAKLMEAGLNVARLNFSHGTYEEHAKVIKTIRELSPRVAILQDLCGPKIRTGQIKDGSVKLEEGKQIILTGKADILGDENKISISHAKLQEDVKAGTRILLDDGLLEFAVLEVVNDEVVCKVINGGILSSHKGVNVPNVTLQVEAMTEKDKEDLIFGISQEVDLVAVSFVRTASDLFLFRHILDEHKVTIPLIAKIEKHEAVNNIDEIIAIADGVMVARGDLGVEIPQEEVPMVQKMIIKKAIRAAKPVITATQMLDSMIRNPRPTRAEINDVANAILDGTDAIMLSGETASGKYPVQAVKTMHTIACFTEKYLPYEKVLSETTANPNVAEVISRATTEVAYELEASAIITSTSRGKAARLVSQYRPKQRIIAAVEDERIYRRLMLSFGVFPILISSPTDTDELLDWTITASLKENYIKNGDIVIITAGIPIGVSGSTNMIKVQLVGYSFTRGIGIPCDVTKAEGKTTFAQNSGEALKKVEQDDILVTPYLTEEYSPIFNKLAGLVTLQGTASSYEAVIAKKLCLPVVVGVQEAFAVLKEGVITTVDSKHGLVYQGEA